MERSTRTRAITGIAIEAILAATALALWEPWLAFGAAVVCVATSLYVEERTP